MFAPASVGHGRNVHELFISSRSRVVRMYNLGPDAATTIASLLHANNVMLPVSSWSLHEQFGGAPPGQETSIWCVFRTHDDACRTLRLDGLSLSVASALEDDLKPFSKLRRFDMYDDIDSSLNINFNLAPVRRTTPNVIYSSNPVPMDEMFSPSGSPPKNAGFLTPPTPTTALSSCGSSSEDGASPPSSTLSLYGQPQGNLSGMYDHSSGLFERKASNSGLCERRPSNSTLFEFGPASATVNSGSSAFGGFTMSTNPPSPRNSFKQGDWICLTPSCAAHNFGRNTACISCGAPRPLDIGVGLGLSKPSTDYDRYFDQRSTLPLSPPPPRRMASANFPPTPAPVTYTLPNTSNQARQVQPPRLPSILTPSGRAFARGGRIQNVSPIPSAPLVMFWPDNEPLPMPCQIRPPFSPGAHPPIMNTGNRGPVEHQPGDWYCGKCSYMNWRRRKVCQTCYPFADGNADSVPASAQAERINILAQMMGAESQGTVTGPKPDVISPTSSVFESNPALGLGLNFGTEPLSPTTPAPRTARPKAKSKPTPTNNLNSLVSSFGSLALDRRASVDHAAGIGMGRPSARHTLRTRQSDAGLRLSGMPFSTRPRASDAGVYGSSDPSPPDTARQITTFPRRIPTDVPNAGLTYGLGRRSSAANIWATDDGPASKLWPTYDLRA